MFDTSQYRGVFDRGLKLVAQLVPKLTVVPRWPDLKDKIDLFGFGYIEEPEYSLSRIQLDHRIQVRDVKHFAPAESVKRFREQMATTEFPPILVTKDDYLVDGNTRHAAAEANKVGFLRAFILDVAFETASPQDKLKLQALAASLNCQTGVALTVAERRKAAIDYLALGWRIDAIRRQLGLSSAIVTQVKREMDAQKKLDQVKLGLGYDNPRLLQGLGNAKVVSLNNAPFRDLAILSRDAGLRQQEILTLANEMRDAGSDEAAIELVARKRNEWQVRIKQRKFVGGGRSTPANLLRQRLGFITGYDGREQELVEHSDDPTVVSSYLATITLAVQVLTRLQKLEG